mmetsp:Transcript_141506/g.352807  ORF Transcript_141506/g.352807 Transcript_141506/m.352807 type:complete len:333 (+) Transcript_141506:487-1485(+)
MPAGEDSEGAQATVASEALRPHEGQRPPHMRRGIARGCSRGYAQREWRGTWQRRHHEGRGIKLGQIFLERNALSQGEVHYRPQCSSDPRDDKHATAQSDSVPREPARSCRWSQPGCPLRSNIVRVKHVTCIQGGHCISWGLLRCVARASALWLRLWLRQISKARHRRTSAVNRDARPRAVRGGDRSRSGSSLLSCQRLGPLWRQGADLCLKYCNVLLQRIDVANPSLRRLPHRLCLLAAIPILEDVAVWVPLNAQPRVLVFLRFFSSARLHRDVFRFQHCRPISRFLVVHLTALLDDPQVELLILEQILHRFALPASQVMFNSRLKLVEPLK